MYRRFGLLYMVFSVLVLAVLVVLLVVRINTVREFNVQEAQTSFIRLQGRVRPVLISRSSDSSGERPDRELASIVREYATQVPTVQAVVLYNPDVGLRYVWTADVDVLDFSRSDLGQLRGFPSYRIREVSQIKVSAPFDIDGPSRLYMDAIYNVLQAADAYGPLRDSLIALLAFAFITVLIAIALSVSGRSRERAGVPGDSGAPAAAVQAAGAPHTHIVLGPETEEFRTESASSQYSSQRKDDSRDPEPMLEEVDIEEIATDPGEPGTLFNPVTGLSHQAHLERRLSLELERAAFNDQDLTCMLVRFEDAAGGGEAYSQRAGQILAAFKFEDLCFEYGADAFCVILPNTELSRGIREAESFKSDHSGRMYFGMSARNGRLVESSRVLGEAERSLEHAQREPGGIVGFRPDPRKYRQFVTKHLGPQD